MRTPKILLPAVVLLVLNYPCLQPNAQQTSDVPQRQGEAGEERGATNAVPSIDSNIEHKKLSFEREKHLDNMKLEYTKAWISGGAILIPLLIAAASIAAGVWSQSKQAKLERKAREEEAQRGFELKVVETVMNAENFFEIRSKGKILHNLFQQRLRPEFATQLNNLPEHGQMRAPDRKRVLMDTLAGHIENKDEILMFWQKIWPQDTWVKALLPDNSRDPQSPPDLTSAS